MKKEIPIVGQTYTYFDNGVISDAKMFSVEVTSLIPHSEAEPKLISHWLEEVDSCDGLYSKETDFLVNAELVFEGGDMEQLVFVRTIDGGWFSLGYWAGSLDVDGELEKKMWRKMS